MLQQFLTFNRDVLITRCREKAAKRFEPSETPAAINHGVPLFLEQLVETLRLEQSTSVRDATHSPTPAPTEIGRAAALHGAEMLRLGYTIDQVVHDYGDVCQSVTELAVQEKTPISTDEFRTLNRCLDDAIADAVTSFGSTRLAQLNERADTLHDRLNYFADEQKRLIGIAIQSYSAIKTGNIGLTGATGTLLVHTLEELRYLADHLLPGIRLASVATTLSR
jgi:hypothetical protein